MWNCLSPRQKPFHTLIYLLIDMSVLGAEWLKKGIKMVLHRQRTWTLYHTIRTFNNLEKEAFWKYCKKRRKSCQPAFYPFPTMFSTLPKSNFNFWVTFILSSTNDFNLDQCKNLSFGTELKPKLITYQKLMLIMWSTQTYERTDINKTQNK